MFKPRIYHRAGSLYSSCTLGIGKFVKCVLSCIPDENLSVKLLSKTFSVLKFQASGSMRSYCLLGCALWDICP